MPPGPNAAGGCGCRIARVCREGHRPGLVRVLIACVAFAGLAIAIGMIVDYEELAVIENLRVVKTD